MNMAQGNQPNNRLGGFANRKFVLINGEYWDCNVNRRRILGQVCLDEFADILLKWFLSNRSLLLRHPPMYDDGYSCQLLEEKGSLEVLKFAYDNAALVDNVDDTTLDWNFAEIVDHLRKRRNQLTHDVRSWTITRFRDFLETMKDASNYLVQPPGRCDAALEKRVNTFISKCERELDHIVQFRNLY
ncbi:Uncharacterized protein APZ42_012493 [Daphnia magna]|uniref:Uncharacterized protein n=1 Tax=Daphnia magna TaxID=35525 RepID=A0A0P5ZCI4_9CRUS|nr:Uncharacterized protein APZ42_012493 [Daphnia magna]